MCRGVFLIARCGCSGAGCGCTIHVDHTNCIGMDISGFGSVDDPFIITADPILSPDMGNGLECRGNGLFAAAGGGGGGGQVNYFTVGTPGPAAFGGLYATPPTLLATADFVGDGINDSVAIQAAIDASDTLATTTGVGSTILILPGIFTVNTPLRPKGIPIIGQALEYCVLYTATSLGAPANTRTIDSTLSGSTFTHIENFQINSLTGGAAIIKSQYLYMLNCVVVGDGKGADAGLLDVGKIAGIAGFGAGYGRFENNIVGGTSSPFPDPGLIIRDTSGGNYSINHNIFTADLDFTGSNHVSVRVTENAFTSCNLNLNAPSLTYFEIRNNQFQTGSIIATLAGGSSFYWTISDNKIFNGQISVDSLIVSKINDNIINCILLGNAIELTTSGVNTVSGNTIDGAKFNGILLTTSNNSVITGNYIRSYSSGTGNTYDGIQIITSDACMIECNSLESGVGRYGINVVSGSLNMVTNNRLNSSGMTASFNDTGAGTITSAGNSL